MSEKQMEDAYNQVLLLIINYQNKYTYLAILNTTVHYDINIDLS